MCFFFFYRLELYVALRGVMSVAHRSFWCDFNVYHNSSLHICAIDFHVNLHLSKTVVVTSYHCSLGERIICSVLEICF
ncbi:hypothetical protein BT93_H1167 [Corymbia citriodora subsp. variegata]|nr:hypothetical protein BT93_H1167 [Corymbia citriodora subsp. variegata]